jgi:hypothetical protein
MQLNLTNTELVAQTNPIKSDTATTITNQLQRERLLYKSVSFNATDGTIDLATATGGDLYVEDVLIYSLTAAADLTSVSIHTNDTVPFEVMTAVEGAAANLVAGKTIKTANSGVSFYLVSGKKLQYTIDTAGNWSGYIVIKYRVISSGSLV